MDTNKLKEIIEKHKKWLNNEPGGEKANLSRSDLRGSDLSYSNLRGSSLRCSNLSRSDLRGSSLSDSDLSDSNLSRSDLSGSDLSGSNLDYSAWPLWCGSLKAHVDDRIAVQLLYHTLSVVQYSPYVSEELKRTLLTRSVIEIANRFHHVGECGELKAYDEAAE